MHLEHERFEQQDVMQTQVGGDHYKQMAIQPAEFIHANGIGFIAGNVIKYVCRHNLKSGKQDLEKALHYLQMLIDMEYPDAEKCGVFGGEKTDCPRWQNGCCDCEPKAEGDGWIQWGGGECPVSETVKVTIKMRCGEIASSERGDECDWLWRDDRYDIIAYKLADV
jgi:hypothetical protein